MSPIELKKLAELIRTHHPTDVLEIGMANGTSSIVMADTLRSWNGRLTSIDPHQTLPSPTGYESAGVHAVAKILPHHRLIEEYDYLALSRLVEAREQFDCILIDGFHSFDLTLLDLFYADKLLAPGGYCSAMTLALRRCIRLYGGLKPISPMTVFRLRCIPAHGLLVVKSLTACCMEQNGKCDRWSGTCWPRIRSNRLIRCQSMS